MSHWRRHSEIHPDPLPTLTTAADADDEDEDDEDAVVDVCRVKAL